MNKILPYVVIAILLGTVTMVVPYALLGSSDYTSITEGGKLIQPSPSASIEPTPIPSPTKTPTDPEQQDTPPYTENRDQLNGDSPTPAPPEPTEQPTPIPYPVPSESETVEIATTGTDLMLESISILSPIGLITIPSFLIALGAFIYLKKRKS